MIVVREVFQAKYGRGDELVALLKEEQRLFAKGYTRHILSDASGPFLTIVVETEVASLRSGRSSYAKPSPPRISSPGSSAGWRSSIPGVASSTTW